MSSHLRHCPKHRKPLPCSHCALAAKPAQAPVAVMDPEPTSAVETPFSPKKRGRPPKYGVAMTPAERKAASRLNQEQKQQDAERRNLISSLMKIFTRQELRIVDDPKRRDKVEERRNTARQQQRVYLADLNQLSVKELRLAIEGKKTPDTRGRLHGERSGEDKRSMGQSEIEQIIAAQQHDSSLFDGPDVEQDPLLAAGFKVRLEGAAPDSDEDPNSDAGDVRSGSAKPEHEPTTNEKWKHKAINSVIRKMVYDSKLLGARCLFCNEIFLTEIGADNHLEEQYAKGERDMERHQEHMVAIAALNSSASMPGGGIWTTAEPAGMPYQHYKMVNHEIELVRRAKRKRNFVTQPVKD